jgi:hypothetical protein
MSRIGILVLYGGYRGLDQLNRGLFGLKRCHGGNSILPYLPV